MLAIYDIVEVDVAISLDEEATTAVVIEVRKVWPDEQRTGQPTAEDPGDPGRA